MHLKSFQGPRPKKNKGQFWPENVFGDFFSFKLDFLKNLTSLQLNGKIEPKQLSVRLSSKEF
jgi:hypothetical protein